MLDDATRHLDETDQSKTPSFIVPDIEEHCDFTIATLDCKDERLATPNHFSEVESSDCSLYEAGKKITPIRMVNAGLGAGN